MEILTEPIGLFSIALVVTVIKSCQQKKGEMLTCMAEELKKGITALGKDGSRCSKDVIRKLSLYIVWMNSPQCLLPLQTSDVSVMALVSRSRQVSSFPSDQ